METHLTSILLALEPLQNRLALVYLCVAALAWKYTTTGRAILMGSTLLGFSVAFAVVVTAVYPLELISYIFYPNYSDHLEPTVASIAWLGMHGHPFYPDWATEDVYGLLYGPVLYLTDGLALLIQPTLTASKIPGVLSLVGALSVTLIAILKRGAGWLTSLLFLSALILLLVPFNTSAYWNRPEPFLTLLSALGLLAATRLRPLAAVSVIGVLAGLAAGFKLNGFLYLMPTALLTLARAETGLERLTLTIVGTACAIVFALLPFVWNQISIVGYMQYLTMASHHGLSETLIKKNVLFAFDLLAPIAVIWFLRKPDLTGPDIIFLTGLCASMLMMIIVGGKAGAGPHHLIPFIPLCLYGAVIVLKPAESRAGRTSAIVYISLFLAYGPGYLLNLWQAVNLHSSSTVELEKIAELQQDLNAYPKAQIGVSDYQHYSDSSYRILSVLKGRALRVDFAAFMDLSFGGVREENVARFISRCEVPTWILPVGAPFTLLSLYTNAPLLSDDFRRTFYINYKLVQIGRAYQVWQCRSSAERVERN